MLCAPDPFPSMTNLDIEHVAVSVPSVMVNWSIVRTSALLLNVRMLQAPAALTGSSGMAQQNSCTYLAHHELEKLFLLLLLLLLLLSDPLECAAGHW